VAIERNSGAVLTAGIALLLFAFHFHQWTRDIPAMKILDAAVPLLLDPAVFLVSTALISLRSGPVYRLMTLYPLQLVGMMCYSIYVWHQPILGKFIQGIKLDSWSNALLPVCMAFALVFLFSLITYVFVEFPHRGIREIFSAPAQDQAATTSPQTT
jgi:peptidoglycan/LPS O-acetylase OafA/YrhL